MSDVASLPIIPWQSIQETNQINQAQTGLKSSKKLPASAEEELQLQKAAAELESLFISYLLKEMRATIPKSGFLSGGKAEEIYTSMIDSFLAKKLSVNGGIGLSSLLVNQFDDRTTNVDK